MGYKYPTPKNMTVKPLVATCPEDMTWRSELPESSRAETEHDILNNIMEYAAAIHRLQKL
jgi:hypothetical protein